MVSSEKIPTIAKPAGPFISPGKRNFIACLLLAVTTLALYNPANRHPFVNYDDDRYVTANPHVRQGLSAHTIAWAVTSTEQANWHPLTWMSHTLDCSVYRLNPAGHHFSSILLHAANVVLLFLLLMWSTGRFAPSLFVSALLAIHPINVESVVWIAERKNVLCTLFFFLALWAYGWYARKPGWARYLAVGALFVAGLASKPMVITFPFVLLLLDYWPLNRIQAGNANFSQNFPSISLARLVMEKLPLLALSAGSAWITVRAQQAGGAMRSTKQFPFMVRLGNAICSYADYLWKMLWPARLAPVYPHPGGSPAAWYIAVAALILITITAIALKFRARRYLLVGWLWFLGTLIPVIGLVQVGDAAMADRYAYIPLIGIFVMIAFGVDDLATEFNLGLWPAVPAAFILLALAAATHRQIDYWQSNDNLWSHTLAVTENNFIAEDNLGGALILEGREEDARPHFEAAARINPKDPMSRSNLGTYFQTHNQMHDAISQYEAAIQLTSDPGMLAQTYSNLGAAHRALQEDEEAQKDFEQSLRLNANQGGAWLGLGLLAQKHGLLDEAIGDLARSVNLQPTAQGFLALGKVLETAGRIPEALGSYQQALRLEPKLAEAQQAIDGLRQRAK